MRLAYEAGFNRSSQVVGGEPVELFMGATFNLLRFAEAVRRERD